MKFLRAATFVALVVICLICVAILALRRPATSMEALTAEYGAPLSRFAPGPDGLRVHYRDEGSSSGRALILLHGYGSSTHTWEPWIARLGARYRLVAIDLPGHGLTQASEGAVASPELFERAIDAVRAQTGIDRFTLIGHSMGGAIAAHYAWAHPQAVEALVLVAPSTLRLSDSSPRAPRWMLASPILEDVDTTAMTAASLRLAYGDQSLVTPALIARVERLSRAPGHRALMAQMLDVGTALPRMSEPDLARITTPTLILQGSQDRIVPMDDARRHRDAIPGARLVTFYGAGHFPQEEAPDRTVEALAAFVDQRTSAPAPAGAPFP